MSNCPLILFLAEEVKNLYWLLLAAGNAPGWHWSRKASESSRIFWVIRSDILGQTDDDVLCIAGWWTLTLRDVQASDIQWINSASGFEHTLDKCACKKKTWRVLESIKKTRIQTRPWSFQGLKISILTYKLSLACQASRCLSWYWLWVV